MSLKIIRTVWLFLGLFAALAVFGQAQWRRPGSWGYAGLNLTDEQLAKIEQLRLDFQESLIPLRMEWEKAQLNADRLFSQGVDQKQTDAALAKLDEIERNLEKAYQDHRNDVRNLLNEEQRVAFDRYGGLGLGLGWDRGTSPRWGMRPGWGRGSGPGRGLGMRGYRPGWGPGRGTGYGRGRGPGMGRGYFCPWYRWR